MSADKKKFYLTTPIYYVNARPHIGHAYTTIVADVLARRHRLLGDDTFFLTGTDEHGQKIERSAAAAGVPPQQFADKVSAEFKALWDRMGLTYDDYIRTTEPRHKLGVQKLFTTLFERGYIYLDSYTGSYCVSDEAFVDAPAGTPCPDCGRLLETVTEENFFFKLSEFQQPLIELIESDKLAITPESRKNEVLSFLRGGLKDLSISRSSFTWGIPVPKPAASLAKQKHVIYVWLDALANYMTAIGYGSDEAKDIAEFERYWPADLHLVGKEIIRFHCVYWPAFLLAAGLPLPKAITAHGWLLFDNAKMSKSKGNIVRTETILEAFGEHVYGKQFPESTKRERDLFAADVLRYFLLREIPFGQDGSFSFDALVTRYNADLANGYGNLVSRTLAMIQRYFDGMIPVGQMEQFVGLDVRLNLSATTNNYAENDFSSLLHNLMNIVAAADGHITSTAPWKLASDSTKTAELRNVLYTCAEAIRVVNTVISSVLPFSSERVFSQLGIPVPVTPGVEPRWSNTKLGALAPIFPRAPKELADIMADIEEKNATASAPAASSQPATEQQAQPPLEPNPPGGAPALVPPSEETAKPAPINIDDFAKIELRVAQIVVAERIPKADKLLRLEVDLGYEKRQILSGIAEWYTPEELIGRRIIVITNLAPRKMRGLESHGMLLAASESEGSKPILATMAGDIALGSRLK
ncbi:MAG TPA: methionine--tRNA ligase [Candidatus Aquilonibacter sp.]|nr:methionine--tRNA ligase [Candidatus Aquilonibacter sp.]